MKIIYNGKSLTIYLVLSLFSLQLSLVTMSLKLTIFNNSTLVTIPGSNTQFLSHGADDRAMYIVLSKVKAVWVDTENNLDTCFPP